MGLAKRREERRLMLFEDTYSMWTERRLTQAQAAELLGVCERTFRRWVERYRGDESDGVEVLRDRRLSRASHRAAPVDEVMRMVDRYRTRYAGWNVRHFYTRYRREGGTRSYNWVRTKLQVAGAVPRGAGRGKHRKRREPSPCAGMMLHQDRLVKELALLEITEMNAANRYLRETYLPAFNAEFARPPKEAGKAFVPLGPGTDLDAILCELHERVAGRDNCVRFDGLKLQLPSEKQKPVLRNRTVYLF